MGLNNPASPTIIGVLLILSALTTSLQFNVLAQEGNLPALFAGSPDTGTKEVPLKGIRQNGEITKVSDYKIDFNNVIQIRQGQNLVLFPEPSDQGFIITKAKLVNDQKQSIGLAPVSGQQNTFSLYGIPNGVYTLQVVGRLGNTEGGYETVLVVPIVTEETRKVVQDRINQILLVEIYVEIIFEEPQCDNPSLRQDGLCEEEPTPAPCQPGESCPPCPPGVEADYCADEDELQDFDMCERDFERYCADITPAEEDENIKRSQECYERVKNMPGMSCMDSEEAEEEEIITEEEDEADEEQPQEEPSGVGEDNGDDNSGGGGDETSQEGSDESAE